MEAAGHLLWRSSEARSNLAVRAWPADSGSELSEGDSDPRLVCVRGAFGSGGADLGVSPKSVRTAEALPSNSVPKPPGGNKLCRNGQHWGLPSWIGT